MSEEESVVAPDGQSPEVVACIRAVVEEVLGRQRDDRRDGPTDGASGSASGSGASIPSGMSAGEWRG